MHSPQWYFLTCLRLHPSVPICLTCISEISVTCLDLLFLQMQFIKFVLISALHKAESTIFFSTLYSCISSRKYNIVRSSKHRPSGLIFDSHIREEPNLGSLFSEQRIIVLFCSICWSNMSPYAPILKPKSHNLFIWAYVSPNHYL